VKELERQRWLAGLALLAALPLPITGTSTWAFVLPYVATAAWILFRRQVVMPLSRWVENLLAPLVLVAVVAAGGLQVGVLRPISHLALLVAAIRLPGAALPGRSRVAMVTTAIITTAGVASSTHPSLVVYLLVALGACIVAAGRSILLGLAASVREPAGRAAWPPARLVALTVIIAILISVPLFAALPRLRSPFVGARTGTASVSGFRSEVTLHGIGSIKASEEPALTVRFPDIPEVPQAWLRLEGATLNHYRGGTWVEGRSALPLPLARQGQTIALWPDQPTAALPRAEVTLEKPGENLFLPTGTVAIEPPLAVEVGRTAIGVLRIPRDTRVPLRYTATFDPAAPRSPPPDEVDLEVPRAVRERIAPLVREVVGQAPNPLAIAVTVEDHLRASYAYTLHPHAPWREDPVIWFLLRGREGHCEFFASAMALMLRVAGVPARIQVGFAGGQRQPDGSFLVRDSRAHAWVLAWVSGRWQVFDPTPPEGQPLIEGSGFRLRLPWRWEDMEAAWDRWVLTFTLVDQADLVRSLMTWMVGHGRTLGLAVAAGGAACWLLIFWRRGRKPQSTSSDKRSPRREDYTVRALQRVMRAGAQSGLDLAPSLSPRAFAAAATAAFPAAGEALGWLVQAHERQRYGGGNPPPRGELRKRVAIVRRCLATGHSRVVRTAGSAGGTGPASQAASHQAATRNGSAASRSTR